MAKTGKGGLGRAGKRHKKLLRKTGVDNVSNGSIRRLARRGGVRRINAGCYDEVRGALLVWIEDILRDAMTYAEHGRRMTVISNDIIYALKRRGVVLCELGVAVGGGGHGRCHGATELNSY